MSKGAKILIGLFVVCIGITVFGVVYEIINKDKIKERNEQQEQALIDNYELVKENIINPEETDIGKLAVNEADTPDNLKETDYIVIRRCQDEGKDVTWEYNSSVSNISFKNDKWTKEDLEKIPVIVFSVSEYISRTYEYVSGGVGTTTIRSETVHLYFYNTKTKTIFKEDVMKGKELPKSTNNSHDYTKSLFDIERQIKKDMGRFVLPFWIIIVLSVIGVIVMISLPTIIINIVTDKKKKRKNN